MGVITIDELIREDGTLQTWSGAGGYSLTFLDNDENAICGNCAAEAVAGKNGWLEKDDLKGAFIHWEGEPLYCDECSHSTDPVYDEEEAEELGDFYDVGMAQQSCIDHALKNIHKEAPWILGEAD